MLNAKTDFTLKSRHGTHEDNISFTKGFACSQLVFRECDLLFIECTVFNNELLQVVEIQTTCLQGCKSEKYCATCSALSKLESFFFRLF